MQNATFIKRVQLRYYKGIEACDVELGPLTFLVGKNGTGKSNFLDALHFVADALRTSLDHALRDRGGVHEVRRRSRGHPTHFAIRIDFALPTSQEGHYSFVIGARRNGEYSVQEEEFFLSASAASAGQSPTYFRIKEGETVRPLLPIGPAAADDSLYLVAASGSQEIKPLYRALSNMGFYNINPDRMRQPQPPDPGTILRRDGSNVASVLRRLEKQDGVPDRLAEYLSKIVPGLIDVASKEIGAHETLEFRQEVKGAKDPWRFSALNMSDGTLRAVGILVALFQSGNQKVGRIPLIGVEEPEAALHPAAAEVLLDSLVEASERVQVLVTSHSPELLDSDQIDDGKLLAAVLDEGVSRIGSVDDASRSTLQDHLYTAGELLRLDQLSPNPEALVSPKQLELFSGQPQDAAPA